MSAASENASRGGGRTRLELIRRSMLGRVAIDRTQTKQSVEAAHTQMSMLAMLDEMPLREMKIEFLRLSRQSAVLLEAFGELAGERKLGEEELQQAVTELWAGLASHRRWLADDAGTPTLSDARAGLYKRARLRAISEWNRLQRFADADPQQDWVASSARQSESGLPAGIEDDLDEYIHCALASRDHEKYERLRRDVVDEADSKTIAEEYGMSSAAVRQEKARLLSTLAGLVGGYLA